MAIIFVSRNSGASDWANNNGFADATVVENFSMEMLNEGDTVIGSLPFFMVAKICKVAKFFALSINLPAELRGKSLTEEQMNECGTSVLPVHVAEEPTAFKGEVTIVTRHKGAVEWLNRKGISSKVKEHFTNEDMQLVDSSTTIIGVLPAEMVAEINSRGGNFIALNLNVPQNLQKQELTADIMEELGASLSGYSVTVID